MTDKEFNDNNVLIAEFMGESVIDKERMAHDNAVLNEANMPFMRSSFYRKDYHLNWNDLMPVVKKIAQLGQGHLLPEGQLKDLMYDLIHVDISCAYKRIVDFIIEYNSKRN